MPNHADDPDGAVFLRILAAAIIRDYANLAGSKAISWKMGRDVCKAADEAAKRAGLGTSPRALDYLIQELTVALADLTLRTTEAARSIADGYTSD